MPLGDLGKVGKAFFIYKQINLSINEENNLLQLNDKNLLNSSKLAPPKPTVPQNPAFTSEQTYDNNPI